MVSVQINTGSVVLDKQSTRGPVQPLLVAITAFRLILSKFRPKNVVKTKYRLISGRNSTFEIRTKQIDFRPTLVKWSALGPVQQQLYWGRRSWCPCRAQTDASKIQTEIMKFGPNYRLIPTFEIPVKQQNSDQFQTYIKGLMRRTTWIILMAPRVCIIA